MKYFFRFDEEKEVNIGGDYSTSRGPVLKGEKVQIGLVHKAKGTGANLHRHPNEQFNVVLQGTLKCLVEGQEGLVKKGGIVYIPANALHYTRATSDEDVIFLAVKDMSWGITGIAEDKNAGIYYEPGFEPESKEEE